VTSSDQIERRLVWILGSPRSGSTWLTALIGAGGDVLQLNEPLIGLHLGVTLEDTLPIEPLGEPPIYRMDQFRREDPDYFFSAASESVWRPGLRALIMERFASQLGDRRYAVIKEPHGSQAAELLMSLFPRSRLIFLLRDGRDVVDSMLDAAQPGSWLIGSLSGFRGMERSRALRMQAYLWRWRTEAVQSAFESHPEELRALVRFEDLREDPGPVIERLAGWLDLDPGPIRDLAERSSADQIENKSRGTFVRSATPGLWREHLSAEEQAEVKGILGETLVRLGYPAD
jgi:Sulfotransferase family